MRTHTGNPYRNTEDSCPTPSIRKDLKKSKNYNQILGLLAARRFMKSPAPSPANAATGCCHRTRRRRKPHRTKALKRTAVDARRRGRAEADAKQPSVGAASRAPSALDRNSPPTTNVGARSSSSIHPPSNRSNHSLIRILERQDQLHPPPPRTAHDPRATPVQGLQAWRPTSIGSPPAPE